LGSNKSKELVRGRKFFVVTRFARNSIAIVVVWSCSGDMFVKITTPGPRQHVKLVESYRDAAGVPRQRVIATLGRIEAVRSGEADSLHNGLWKEVGLADTFRRLLRNRHPFDAERLLRVMVFNRLCVTGNAAALLSIRENDVEATVAGCWRRVASRTEG